MQSIPSCRHKLENETRSTCTPLVHVLRQQRYAIRISQKVCNVWSRHLQTFADGFRRLQTVADASKMQTSDIFDLPLQDHSLVLQRDKSPLYPSPDYPAIPYCPLLALHRKGHAENGLRMCRDVGVDAESLRGLMVRRGGSECQTGHS